MPVDVHQGSATTAGDDVAGSPSSARRGHGRALRLAVRAVLALVVVAVLYFALTLVQVWRAGQADERTPVDAIVVMGAAQYDGRPSPQLAARLDHVLELWPLDVAPVVVVTGGNRPGDRFTEAEASMRYLADRGIPEESIVREDGGESSYGSLAAVAEILLARGMGEVVVVTDPYHALRSRLIAQEVGLDANVSSTASSVVTGSDSVARHVEEAGGVALGRLIGFERLTDLVG
ncbi:YdcF family protein [Ilumatobacter sp.]|uniref:YdcF family protein n=1 Tax=Ilumatobacter sp. TaxID=1967498 RepID=UPI003B52934C